MLPAADKWAGTCVPTGRGRYKRLLPVLALLLAALMLARVELERVSAQTTDSPQTGTQFSAIPNEGNEAGQTIGQSSDNPRDSASEPADCGDWDIVPDPGGGPAGNVLYSVAVVSASDVWAVGLYGYTADINHTLIEHWDGSAWNVVSSPNFGPGSNVLKEVAAVSGTDVWAVGYYSESYGGAPLHTLIEHWDGSAWNITPGPDPESGYLEGVTAISGSDVWAVGHRYNQTIGQEYTLIEHWDGSTWSIVRSPNFGSAYDNLLMSVTAISGSDVWAVGSYYNSTIGQTLIEHWDGSSWNIVASPNLGSGDNLLLRVAGVSGSDVWAVGEYSETTGAPTRTLIEHWDGSAWNVVSSPNFGSNFNHLGGVAVSGSEAWAVGYYCNSDSCRALVEHWDGNSWNIVPSPSREMYSHDYLNGVAVVTVGDVWAVGYFNGESPQSNTLIEHYLTICPTATPQPTQTPGGPTASPTLPATCTIRFSDVPPGSTFYQYIECLACLDIIQGYPDGTFKPANDVSRGQLSKIISNAVGFDEDYVDQTFTDVPLGSTFYQFIERMARRDFIDGYPCGGVGEPCDGQNRPYFRPSSNATRGQIAKIDVVTAVLVMGWALADPPDATFADVPPGSTFYQYIETAAAYGVLTGHPCGGVGEPCDPQNRPYFRSNDNATRGQTAKIVSNTFLPNCQILDGSKR